MAFSKRRRLLVTTFDHRFDSNQLVVLDHVDAGRDWNSLDFVAHIAFGFFFGGYSSSLLVPRFLTCLDSFCVLSRSISRQEFPPTRRGPC